MNRTTAALHVTLPPVVLGVLRAQARLRAGGGAPSIGAVLEGLARGEIDHLVPEVWSAAERVAARARDGGAAPGVIVEAVESAVVKLMVGQN